MTKNKKTNTVEDTIKNLSIGATIGGDDYYSNSLIGKEVSLNQKKASNFRIGSLDLTNKRYSAKIKEDITSDQEQVIRKGLSMGLIVEGNVYIPPIDRDNTVLEEYWNLIKVYDLNPADPRSKSMPKFKLLYKKGVDRNWTAKEVAKFCMEQEKKYKNRERVLKLLNDLHKYSDCPDTLLEEPAK